MTIYVHFNIRSGKSAVKLHNVATVTDNGPDSIRVSMQFADAFLQTFRTAPRALSQ